MRRSFPAMQAPSIPTAHTHSAFPNRPLVIQPLCAHARLLGSSCPGRSRRPDTGLPSTATFSAAALGYCLRTPLCRAGPWCWTMLTTLASGETTTSRGLHGAAPACGVVVVLSKHDRHGGRMHVAGAAMCVSELLCGCLLAAMACQDCVLPVTTAALVA